MPNLTRQELEAALRGDEEALTNRRGWLAIIDRGDALPPEAVHLTRANAAHGIAGLEQAIANKRRGIAELIKEEDRLRSQDVAPRGPYKRRPTVQDKAAEKDETRKEKRRGLEDDRTKLRGEVADCKVRILDHEEKRDKHEKDIAAEKKKIKATEKKIDALTGKIKKLA